MAIQPINSGRAPIIWSTVDEAFAVINENFVELDNRSAGTLTQLTNGENSLILDESGNLTLAGNDLTVPNYIIFEAGSLIGDEPGNEFPIFRIDAAAGQGIRLTSDVGEGGNNSQWYFDTVGNLTLPVGGDILDSDGNSVLGGGGEGGVGLSSRVNLPVITTILAPGATDNVTIIGFKGYILYKIETSGAAWVRVYSDLASRMADSARLESTDPLPGSGVIAEVITTAAQTIPITPGAIGFSNETIPDSNIQLAVTNKSGMAATITVTLTLVQLEA